MDITFPIPYIIELASYFTIASAACFLNVVGIFYLAMGIDNLDAVILEAKKNKYSSISSLSEDGKCS